MVDKLKSTKFKQVDYKTWKKVATKSLQGIPVEDLITQTVEGIAIQPLYTREQLEAFSYEESMIATVRQGKPTSKWTVAQKQYVNSGEEFLKQLQDSLQGGAESIVYDGENPVAWEEGHLEKLAELIRKYPIYAFNLVANDLFITALKLIPLEARSTVHGAISGESIVLPDGYEQIRTVSVDVRKVHHDGADSVTELAIALAKAADAATLFDTFMEFENKLFVHFSIDTHFFMEIAKLRAFRVLWRTFREAYGETKSSSVPVISENSLRSYSKLDPYVNLLRAGNEALSAVLGGTDVLTVHPHDVLTGVTPASIRLARNVQLIIKEEALVSEVLDPAGGSYFIEVLTKELVEKAWTLFLKIESQGGYEAFVASGELKSRLKQLQKTRREEIARNEKSMIGTNVYADLSTPFIQTEDVVPIRGRLAKPYEKLRGYFESHGQPGVVLLTFGELKDFKPRADFVSGYLATGGIKCEWSPAFSTAKEAHEWIGKNDFDYGIVCANAAKMEAIMPDFLKGMSTSLWLDVAGKYDQQLEKAWLQAGVNGFIYKGQDQIDKLTAIKNRWKGEG